LTLNYSKFEIIVVSDSHIVLDYPNIKILHTGLENSSPAEKRDIAINQCKGEIYAFIDDDAFPAKNWLKNAVKHFKNPKIGVVVGPGITPDSDSLMQKAGGAVYSSVFGSGKIAYRFTPKAMREVDDYPAYNLLVRKSILKQTKGFNSTFYGGEDTKLCLSIRQLQKKLIYDPKVLVYHHRRPLFKAHLKQVYNVGIHRGYFVKAFPETSRRLFYFLPSIISIVLSLGIFLSFFSKVMKAVFLTVLALWLIAGFISVLRINKDIKIAFLAALGIVATHLTYGIAFLRGLAIKELKR